MNTDRLKGAVDLNLMKSAKVVGIGSGGASGLYEDLVRCGLGNLTVIDFDTVDATNLCTQGYGIGDIGTPKVEALKHRLLSVNPDLNYTPVNGNLLKMGEDEIEGIVKNAELLLFMTDDFHAQARGNLIALKFQIPGVFAIVYYRARCAEITFTIPGVTPACHRCATSPRYGEYQKGYENDVTSGGSSIMQTHYLNACIGMISLSILHRDNPNCEFGGWFGREDKWKRNLVQLRMTPLYGEGEETLFHRTFQNCERVFTFDSVWQMIEPECPPKYDPCPDCGGFGDIRKSAMKVDSTIPKI